MKTVSRNTERQTKTVRNNGRADVMSHYKKLSADWTREYYTLCSCMCGTCGADPDTFVASEDYLGVFEKGNAPCNAEDNLHAGHLVIEAWFRG